MFINNRNFDDENPDVLYHFGMATGTHDLPKLFGDVKFVCVGGAPSRMTKIANKLMDELKIASPTGSAENICESDRYVMYKVGPVLVVNHGMGMPSMSIMMHELLKLLHHAHCTNVEFFRVGTSGGVGVPPGTVVVTEQAYNALLEPSFKTECIGKIVSWSTTLDQELCDELVELGTQLDLPVIKGKSMGTNDFYEGQGRLDGALCCYTMADKMTFLEKAKNLGIKNIEMEAPAFAAMLNRAGVKGAVICVALLDRMKGDQIFSAIPVLKGYEDRPIQLMIAYIKKRLQSITNGVHPMATNGVQSTMTNGVHKNGTS